MTTAKKASKRTELLCVVKAESNFYFAGSRNRGYKHRFSLYMTASVEDTGKNRASHAVFRESFVGRCSGPHCGTLISGDPGCFFPPLEPR